MSNITFVIFTFNEEKRIEYVIRNFIKYGEVLILDDGSTDRTREITEKLGGKFLLRPKSNLSVVENEKMYDFVKQSTKTDWLFWGFADNLAPKSLLEKLSEISMQKKYKYVSMPLYHYLWGETKIPAYKGRSSMFMKEFFIFKDKPIHVSGKFLGKEDEKLTLPNRPEFAMRHFSLYDLEKFTLGHLRYAKIEAFEKYESGVKFSSFKLIKDMGWHFLRYFKNGFKNKEKGLLVGLVYSFFRLMVHFCIFELENNLNLETIESDYIKEKERLIKECDEK